MALHFVVGWIYLTASPWWLPRVAEAVAEAVILKENPFTPPPPPTPEPESAAEPDQPNNPNPFAAPAPRDKARETDQEDSAS
jgi:hypothetical protein